MVFFLSIVNKAIKHGKKKSHILHQLLLLLLLFLLLYESLRFTQGDVLPKESLIFPSLSYIDFCLSLYLSCLLP